MSFVMSRFLNKGGSYTELTMYVWEIPRFYKNKYYIDNIIYVYIQNADRHVKIALITGVLLSTCTVYIGY